MDNTAIISTLLSQLDTDILRAELAKREGATKRPERLTEKEIIKNQYKEQLKQKMHFNGEVQF